MGNPRLDRELVYVTPYTGATIKYGFKTNVRGAERVALGHTVAVGNEAQLVIGANSPKPGRASKGGTNSYYDVAQRNALKAAKWVLTPGKRRRALTTARTKPVYVTIDGVKYAWNQPTQTHTAIAGEAAALGVVDATRAMDDLVFGASFPKPPRARKLITVGEGANQREESYSTFIDPDAADSVPAGWAVLGTGKENTV